MFQDFPAEAQQLLLTSFQTVQPNTAMLMQNIFSLYGSSHCDIKQSWRNWQRIHYGWKTHSEYIPNYVQHDLLQGLTTRDTDSLNESVSLISIPSCHTESVSGEVQQTESISIHQKTTIRIMAYTKSKSSVRNYVHILQRTSKNTHYHVVESMKMMGGGGTKFTYTQYTSTAQT
jgi:hypothetical protein